MVKEVKEGNIFDDIDRYFHPGIIDNVNGTIKDIYAITIGGNTSTMGTFVIITFQGKQLSGIGNVSLTNVLVGDPKGRALPFITQNGSIIVETTLGYDLNGDGYINILDLVQVVSRWGETGVPGWIAMDVNIDGVIDYLDVILIGQHWTG
jgi:hypothetical protein